MVTHGTMEKAMTPSTTRPCRECGRSIRWGTRTIEGKRLVQRARDLPPCWDCAAEKRATARKEAK